MSSKRRELLQRTAQRGKYAPLHHHLQGLKGEEWRTTFDEIEKVLGFDLPDSARVHRPWWANQGERGGHSHALAWEMAGWKTSQVNLADETLVFVRDAATADQRGGEGMIDYATRNPALLDRVKHASDDGLARLFENAKAKLPEAQWLVDAIVAEQVQRGGVRNMNANSVRQVILKHARKGRTCTYKTIAAELGIEWNQAHRRMPKFLDEISTMEHEGGRPLLTAIVVAQSGRCGEGFFKMARRNGLTVLNEREFQEQEQHRVFDYWEER